MQTWADGYITEMPYTRNFFPDLSPVNLRLACALAGFTPPSIDSDFDYCELGCGQGLTTALLAAAYPKGRFFGVDFNPTHIGLARKFAEESGIQNVTFLDASFEEAMDQDDLPTFDFIALHGIYSWISDVQQQNIIAFIHRFLKTGGAVYNSYNAKPGKTELEPIHRIFKELLPSSENPIQQVNQGVALLDSLLENPRGIFRQQQGLKQAVQNLKQQPREYIVHEFLNEYWTSFFCTDMFKEMANAKLTYVGSTIPDRNFDALSVPQPFLKPYQAMATLEQRQLFRDLLLNTAFRKDVYIRGPIPIPQAERRAVNTTILLGCAPFHQQFQKIYRCGAGEVDMSKDKDIPQIFERLKKEVMPLAELVHGMEGMEPAKVMEGVRHLLAGGQIRAYAAQKSDHKGISRVNRLAINTAVRDWQGVWLCSELLGNAVNLSFIQVLMLKAHLDNDSSEDAIPAAVADAIVEKGAGITVNNREIKEREDIIRHVKDMYEHFRGTITELERLQIL